MQQSKKKLRLVMRSEMASKLEIKMQILWVFHVSESPPV